MSPVVIHDCQPSSSFAWGLNLKLTFKLKVSFFQTALGLGLNLNTNFRSKNPSIENPSTSGSIERDAKNRDICPYT